MGLSSDYAMMQVNQLSQEFEIELGLASHGRCVSSNGRCHYVMR